MASGSSAAAEEEPRGREKQHWSENIKVYTRRANKNTITRNPILAATETATVSAIPNNETNETATTTLAATETATAGAIPNNETNETATTTLAATASATPNKGTNKNNIDKNEKENQSNDHIPNGGGDNEDGIPEKSASSPKLPVEDANSSQHHVTSSRPETGSENSSILNRTEVPVPNGHDENLVNGSVNAVVTRVDDRVNISVSAAASSKEVVRELKRKLMDELSQVRKMAKILEDKEIQIVGYSSSGIDIDVGVGGVGGTIVPVVSTLQFPANGVAEKGVGRGVRVVGLNNKSRLVRQLSVSVMENSRGVGEIMEKEKRTPKANQYYRNSEFLLGKEKLPPTESHRKSKLSGSKKHGGREVDYGFGVDKQLFKKCNNLLQKLMKHKHGWVFNQPVDVQQLGLHDYFDIIKHPMDLGTVNTRLTRNWYKTPREFAEDVRLTFYNAMTYNPEGQDVHVMARDLLRIFEDRWTAIETEFDRKLRYKVICDLSTTTPTSTKSSSRAHVPAPFPLSPPPLLQHPPSFQEQRRFERSQSMPVPQPLESRSFPAYIAGRTPAPKKPKAKDPNKRDMTFEEKQKLSTNLQSLPVEKLDAIVQIIKKNNTALSQHNDEIEVDIDSVDTETLWELDRFVTNYKKNLSKQKRKAELAQARALAAQAARETNTTPINVEAAKETREGEVNVPGSNAQQERHSDKASGSSSSSSSSSGSGSSSSDSDSSSSSSSGSDGGGQ